MGKTGDLREYLSSISTTIANTSGGSDKDKINPSDLFKRTYDYLINFSNLEAITVTDINGTTGTRSVTSGDFTQFVPFIIDSHLRYVTLLYKNKWQLSISVSEPIYIESQQYTVSGTGVIMATDSINHISYLIGIESSSSDNPNINTEYRLSFGNPPDDVTTFVLAQDLVEQ